MRGQSALFQRIDDDKNLVIAALHVGCCQVGMVDGHRIGLIHSGPGVSFQLRRVVLPEEAIIVGAVGKYTIGMFSVIIIQVRVVGSS